MTSEATLDQRFADAMGQILGPDFPSDIGLAVSGGGDSMAMLTLAHNWARVWGVRLWVVTVDHGLREESAAEAAMVAEECAALGHPHATLKWSWDGQGNLQSCARDARLELIDRWRGLITHVLMAHTQDDVAETYLTRLARSAGVEGLSSMKAKRRVQSVGGKLLDASEFEGALPVQVSAKGIRPGWFHIVRPCLEMSRAELRHYLATLKGQWVEDPSNDDPKYDRVRMRKALARLDDHHLSAETFAAAAKRMSRAAEALRARAVHVFREIGMEGRLGHHQTGEILFDRAGFEKTERDTQMRLLSYALSYISSQTYRPREVSLEELLDRLLGGGGGTLHGCETRMEREQLRVFREFAAVADLRETVGNYALWDKRWRVFDNGLRGQTIRALGPDGWAQARERVSDWPDTAPPFHTARALPSIWEGDTLRACDALNLGRGYTSRLWPMGREMYGFSAHILSH